MKVLKTNGDNFDKSIMEEAIKVMAHGGVILYPTDTVYGLGANIFNRTAVKRIFDIKKRAPFKPLSILVSSKEAINLVSKVDYKAQGVINQYLPGPYTIILNKTNIVPRTVTGGLSKVGIRVPDYEIACSLANLFPIITTSANIANEKTFNNPDDILNQLDTDLDLVIDVGELESKPSTIIDVTGESPNFIKR